jgi:hypothetical protein
MLSTRRRLCPTARLTTTEVNVPARPSGRKRVGYECQVETPLRGLRDFPWKNEPRRNLAP